MSAIADFRLIEISKLNELRNNAESIVEKKFFGKKLIDNYWNYVDSNSEVLKEFKWSGYIFAHLLVFLKEKKAINLLEGKYTTVANEISEKRNNSTFIFTYDHKKEYLGKLDSDNFSLDELSDFNYEFSKERDPSLAQAEIDGIKALNENLSLLNDGKVLLLSIG